MDQVVVFQKMFEQVRKEQNFSWFYSELKHHRIAHYIYYLATDNIRIIPHRRPDCLRRNRRKEQRSAADPHRKRHLPALYLSEQ